MSQIAQLLIEQARVAAAARQASGAAWGNAIANVSQVPAQVMAQQDADKRQQQADALARNRDTREGQSATDAHEAHAAELDKMRQATASDWAAHQLAANADPATLAAEVDRQTGKLWKPDEAAAIKQQIATPEGAKHFLTTLAPVLPPKAPVVLKNADGSESLVPSTGGAPLATGGTTPKAMTPAEQAQRYETERHNRETERIGGLTAGRQQAAEAETARHNRAMENAANPFGSAPTGANGAAGPTGDDFLKTVPAAHAAQIKALAEGRQPFPTGMSYAKLQPLIAAVTQYDPTFDAANYTARSKARADLTSPSGTGGKTINSLNTAIQHLGRLSDLIETEANSNIPLVNTLVNPLRTAVGSTKVTNFNAVQPQAMKEIERLWRGAGGSEGDINALKDSLNKNAGQQQQREALQEFVNLVRGKLDSTEQQRDNILGPTAGKSVPVLFEQNKPVLEKIGQRATGGPFLVTPKDGPTLSFPTEAQAAAFKKAHGL